MACIPSGAFNLYSFVAISTTAAGSVPSTTSIISFFKKSEETFSTASSNANRPFFCTTLESYNESIAYSNLQYLKAKLKTYVNHPSQIKQILLLEFCIIPDFQAQYHYFHLSYKTNRKNHPYLFLLHLEKIQFPQLLQPFPYHLL